MKEMMKQKMMNRFHKRNSSSSSSVDFKSGERVDFKFSTLQALQVPKGWDKLSLSLISVETDKTINKTGRASVWNGNCRWTETLSESIWLSSDDASKEPPQYLYKLLVSKGSSRSGILGEVTVNLSNHLSSETSLPIALPLKKCDHGTILQVNIQCLTPRANSRNEGWRDTDSLAEDVNGDYSDLDSTSDAPDGKNTKNVESSRSNSIVDASHAKGLGSRETSISTGRSHRSFDSMEDSFGPESFRSNLSEAAVDPIKRPESTSSQSSTYSPRPNHSPSNLGSGKHTLNQRQDSGKASNAVPASPLRAFGSSEFLLETEGTTPAELRAEARTWERKARKLMVDLDISRKDSSDQTRNLENVTMELSASQTECNRLKHEIEHLKVLLGESAVKERDADDLKVQVQDRNDLQTELEEEIKFQKELNEDLALQLNKTQEANLELVSVLQELEDTIEKQRLEIKNLSASELQEVSRNSPVEDPKTDLLMPVEENDKRELELELQKFLETQTKLEVTILNLEKTLEDKTQEIEDFKNSETEWIKKLRSKEKEVFNLEAKLSEALGASVFNDEPESRAIENPDLIEEVKALKEKILELERDCNELTEENLELLFKLKESSKDLSTSGTSINSSLGERPSTESPSIEDSEVVNLESQIWPIKDVPKKPNGTDADYLQTRCHDLEIKCAELDIQMQGFKDRACYLEDELEKYRAKAEEQENEIASLNRLLKDLNHFGNEMNDDEHEKLITELESRVEDLGKELLDKTHELEGFKSDCLLKEEEIQSRMYSQRDLETQLSDLQIVNSQLEERLKATETEFNGMKDSHISDRKILEKKLLELESCNRELELHLTELEDDNLHLSERVSGLEPQLRHLTDARESSRLEAEHSESRVANLQAKIEKLENELEISKVDMRQKVQDMQKRWLEAQEECEYLRKANPKLEATTENLMEECSSLQKSNSELRQQRLELHNRCTNLEAELKESRDRFSKLSKNLEDLEEKISVMLDGISSKGKTLDSELDFLHLEMKENTEKYVSAESLLNRMYSEKVVEVENLRSQISATHDERDRMASEAILEMHVLRADKDKLEKSIAEIESKLRSSEKNLNTIRAEYESKILDLTDELATSKRNCAVLAVDREKLTELFDNTRSNEEKLKKTIGELKSCEYGKLQLSEENSSLKIQLQKIPVLQDEIVALKNSLNDLKYENERLEASLQMISGDYEQLKEEKTSLLHKTTSMQKALIESEDHKRNKIALEEKLLRLQGDLTTREALCAQEAELKNELGRLKRSNSQLQRKIKALEEQKKGSKGDEDEFAANNLLPSFGSDSTSSLHEDVEAVTVDEPSRIRSLQIKLAEALEANEMYKEQLKSFLAEGQEVKDEAIHKEHKLEAELRELQERYLHMSLKYAEVEAQREDLVLKLKAVGPGRGWFS